jgi:hypothetical protein
MNTNRQEIAVMCQHGLDTMESRQSLCLWIMEHMEHMAVDLDGEQVWIEFHDGGDIRLSLGELSGLYEAFDSPEDFAQATRQITTLGQRRRASTSRRSRAMLKQLIEERKALDEVTDMMASCGLIKKTHRAEGYVITPTEKFSGLVSQPRSIQVDGAGISAVATR